MHSLEVARTGHGKTPHSALSPRLSRAARLRQDGLEPAPRPASRRRAPLPRRPRVVRHAAARPSRGTAPSAHARPVPRRARPRRRRRLRQVLLRLRLDGRRLPLLHRLAPQPAAALRPRPRAANASAARRVTPRARAIAGRRRRSPRDGRQAVLRGRLDLHHDRRHLGRRPRLRQDPPARPTQHGLPRHARVRRHLLQERALGRRA